MEFTVKLGYLGSKLIRFLIVKKKIVLLGVAVY